MTYRNHSRYFLLYQIHEYLVRVKDYHSPNRDSMPLPTQTTRLSPTEPVSAKTPFGEMNIPEPVT